MDLSELHDCEKSHGKIVAINMDHVGITRCGYCNEQVDYKSFFLKHNKDFTKWVEQIKSKSSL